MPTPCTEHWATHTIPCSSPPPCGAPPVARTAGGSRYSSAARSTVCTRRAAACTPGTSGGSGSGAPAGGCIPRKHVRLANSAVPAHQAAHRTPWRTRLRQSRLQSQALGLESALAHLAHAIDDASVWVKVRLRHVVTADHMGPATAASAPQRAARHLSSEKQGDGKVHAVSVTAGKAVRVRLHECARSLLQEQQTDAPSSPHLGTAHRAAAPTAPACTHRTARAGHWAAPPLRSSSCAQTGGSCHTAWGKRWASRRRMRFQQQPSERHRQVWHVPGRMHTLGRLDRET